MFDEAQRKGVFVMEARWTRFFPLVLKLQDLLHGEKVIGDVHRVFCNFALSKDIVSLPSTSRHKNPTLGAGTLLDIGIYSLTRAILGLESGPQDQQPTVIAS